jgi:hypothetical protein
MQLQLGKRMPVSKKDTEIEPARVGRARFSDTRARATIHVRSGRSTMTSNVLHRYAGAAATCCILPLASGCVGENEGNEPRQEPVAEVAEALTITAPV